MPSHQPTLRRICRAGGLALAALLTVGAPAQERPRRPTRFVETDNIKHFRMQSAQLTAFWGRPMHMDAGVVLPPGFRKDERLPVCYSIHGFGGSHLSAMRSGSRLLRAFEPPDSDYPRMVYVFLNASCPLGHHVFADSANNGPVGTALVEELIPALEREYGAFGKPTGRFLTGHSSGGWASLWVQLRHPEFFNGVWSTAPDSVDFRDFTGINVYDWSNAYTDPDGKEIGLVRRGGEFVMSFRQFTEREVARRAYGGQIASFDAVFSPKGDDGRPMPMFDRTTGAIDRDVAKAWEKYDITRYVQRNWARLREPLRGKVHVFMGTLDTFRLEGALYRFAADVEKLGADFDIRFVEGRDHGTLFQPHARHWPNGMLERIHRDMRARFQATRKR